MPVAFSAVVFLASAAIVAYLADWCGLPIQPSAVLLASALGAAGTFVSWRRANGGAGAPASAGDGRQTEPGETAAFITVVSALFAWLLWLARPSLLPVGSGPDLTHHLALIDYIERYRQLPHDPLLAAALGEMVNYTPGAHLLGALAGAWVRSDGLHAIHPVVALTVALKAGLIFLIALRMMPPALPRIPLALSAVLLLFQPRDYFIGSFADASYLAQVVSELFAVAMWLAIVHWTEQPSPRFAVLIAVCGAATFLAWPVALGPVLLLAAVTMACRVDRPLVERARHLLLAIVPIVFAAAIHARGRAGALAIVGVAGYVAYPRVDLFGSLFLAAAAIGIVASLFDRSSRTVATLLATITLQSAALLIVARRAGAARPYMALKMFYLAIYPMAVAGSLALACGISVLQGTLGRTGRTQPARKSLVPVRLGRLPCASVVAWAATLGLGVSAARLVIRMPQPRPAVSQPLFLAGDWARTNLKPECVDYVVDDVFSAYWLHIAVLRNARAAPRSVDDDTYQPEKQRVRWVEPDGLPYAIAADFDRLPRDVRVNVDLVARFGPAAIIKRRGQARCEGENSRF